MFAAFSVLALAIGPITLIAMMFDPNTPIWAPLAIVVAVILCIIPAVIVADAVDGSTGVSILDRVFDRRVQNKVADWVLGLAVAGAFIWYVRGGG